MGFNPNDDATRLNQIAEKYVTLGLTIGQYDKDFVESYYGPESLKPTQPKLGSFPKEDLLSQVAILQAELSVIKTDATGDNLRRAKWISAQLLAYSRRIKIFSGEYSSFDVESQELFGITAPVYSEAYFKNVVAHLDSVLPGKGDFGKRFQTLMKKFTIPKSKLDVVFKAAISEARKRTLAHYQLPATENFTLRYVTNKSWASYCFYQGNYQSVLEVNTDLPIPIDQAIVEGCHESYPGHHVYNIFLEKNLYHDKGWVELSIYPLFSPLAIIAEGSANYGDELVFPADEKVNFAKNILLPLAGLDTTGISTYFKVLAVNSKLNYIVNEAARGLVNGTMSNKEVLKYVGPGYVTEKQIAFIKEYRSYVISYNLGQDIVKNYIESHGGNAKQPAACWDMFEKLLSNEVLTSELLK